MEIRSNATGAGIHKSPLETVRLDGDTLELVAGYKLIFAADEVAKIREALGAGETDGASVVSLRKRLALVQS